MSENYQHSGPKQDTGENVAISSAPTTKLKNKGSRRGSKNYESGSDVREASKCEECEKIFKSETDRMLECEYCGNRYCIKCLKIKPGEYEAMGEHGCMWFCLKCKPKNYLRDVFRNYEHEILGHREKKWMLNAIVKK